MKRFVIIDSNALVHRAYHSIPPLTNKKGELINVVYGYLLAFFRAIQDLEPDFIAATFDLPGPTFRHKKFKEYKANRPKTPKGLFEQIPKIKEVLRAFNIPVFEKSGFEADDIIGTISKKLSDYSHSCLKGDEGSCVESIAFSSDLDLLQLIDEYTKVYALRRGLKEIILYDKEAVEERYEIKPKQLIDYKGLRGDPSDNIPGILGVGEKTAIKLIKKFKTLENLYLKLDKDPSLRKESIHISPRLLTKIKENREEAFFNRSLVKIIRDVPINFNKEECLLKDYDKNLVEKKFEELGLYSLIIRIRGLPVNKLE